MYWLELVSSLALLIPCTQCSLGLPRLTHFPPPSLLLFPSPSMWQAFLKKALSRIVLLAVERLYPCFAFLMWNWLLAQSRSNIGRYDPTPLFLLPLFSDIPFGPLTLPHFPFDIISRRFLFSNLAEIIACTTSMLFCSVISWNKYSLIELYFPWWTLNIKSYLEY